MPHALQNQVAGVRRQARRVLLAYGLGWTFATTAAVLLLLGLADYFIRFEDIGIRIIATAATLLVSGACAYAYLVKPLSHRLRDVDIAQQIERQHPALDERLSSAIEFLDGREDDAVAGSPQLRRAVVAQATTELERVDLRQVVNRQPARRALLAAGGALMVGLIVVLLNPLAARIALARLAAPLGVASWPQKNNLAFENPPTRIALGQSFEVELVDRNGNLPQEVRIHYRFLTDGETTGEVEVMQPYGDRMLAHRDRVTRPFEYRAEGGDDRSMEWIPLEVVEPPLVESFAITLHPPAYTGHPPRTSEKRIRALRGTQVEIAGVATKPLTAAQLQIDGADPIDADISGDGYSFTISAEDFVIDKSAGYWFQLTDKEQLSGGANDRWDIRAITDTPPSVSFEEPASNVFVTADAEVPIRLLVKDNLAIRDTAVLYTRSDRSDEGDFRIPLYQGPAQALSPTDDRHAARSADLGESRVVEYQWRLDRLGLQPGIQLTVNAVASDYLPQTGQSASPRRITIISAAELEERLAARQAFILSELARALKMQQEARGQTADLEIQLREVGRLTKSDLDHVQSAELNQRQVTRTLTSRTEGIPAHVESLLADLASNKINSPDILRRMQNLLNELDRLAADHLPKIGDELTAAQKAAQSELELPPAKDKPSAAGPPLQLAAAEQDHVIATLEALLGNLSQWADYRRFGRDVRHIHTQQKELEERTREIGALTITRDLTDLTPQQRAELKKLGQSQLDLARRLDKVLQGMQQMQSELDESDPLAAATLDDALHVARQRAISGTMRHAGAGVEQNQVGQAVGDQAQAAKQLEEMLDVLSNRREHELERLVEKLREAERTLAGLRHEQRGLRKKLEETAKNPNQDQRRRELQRLLKQQKDLQEEIARLARKLKRLQADRAGRSTERGAQQLGQSSEAGQQGDAGRAADKAKTAEKDLDEAQAQLAEARRRAEADLAEERLAQLEDTLKSLRDQQQRVLDDTVRLEGLRRGDGTLGRDETISLRHTALHEEMLTAQTRELAEKMRQVAVFRVALEGAAGDLDRATQLLHREQTGGGVQAAEQAGLDRINLLLTSLTDDDSGNPDKQGDQGSAGQGGSGQSGAQTLHDIAELKLLKLLQLDVNQRTQQLQQDLSNTGDLSEDQLGQLDQLSREQGQLADLVFNLVAPTKDQDDPEALPDFDLEGDPGKKPGGLDDLETLPELDLGDSPDFDLKPKLEEKLP